MTDAQRPKPDLKKLSESMLKTAEAFDRLGAAARSAGSSTDRLVIADHPDLDEVNRTMNNLYGNSFD